MFSTLYSVGITGIDAFVVTVECSTWDRIPQFELIGLPKSKANQAKKRIQCAIEYSGYVFPPFDIMVSLVPVDFKQEGSALELAIACSILQCDGIIPSDYDFSDKCLLGGLALSGDIQPVSDISLRINAAKDSGKREVFVPIGNIEEATAVDGIRVFGVKNIRQLVNHVHGVELIESATH